MRSRNDNGDGAFTLKMRMSMPSKRHNEAPPLKPGDEGPVGTPGTGENICRKCNGTGRVKGESCPNCLGTGRINEGVGGG